MGRSLSRHSLILAVGAVSALALASAACADPAGSSGSWGASGGSSSGGSSASGGSTWTSSDTGASSTSGACDTGTALLDGDKCLGQLTEYEFLDASGKLVSKADVTEHASGLASTEANKVVAIEFIFHGSEPEGIHALVEQLKGGTGDAVHTGSLGATAASHGTSSHSGVSSDGSDAGQLKIDFNPASGKSHCSSTGGALTKVSTGSSTASGATGSSSTGAGSGKSSTGSDDGKGKSCEGASTTTISTTTGAGALTGKADDKGVEMTLTDPKLKFAKSCAGISEVEITISSYKTGAIPDTTTTTGKTTS